MGWCEAYSESCPGLRPAYRVAEALSGRKGLAHGCRLPSSDSGSAELRHSAASALFEPKALEKAFKLGEEENGLARCWSDGEKDASKAKGVGVGRWLAGPCTHSRDPTSSQGNRKGPKAPSQMRIQLTPSIF